MSIGRTPDPDLGHRMVAETDKIVAVDIMGMTQAVDMHMTQVVTVEIEVTVEIDMTVEIDKTVDIMTVEIDTQMAVDIDISVEMTRRSSTANTDGMARKNNVTIMVNLE